MLTAVDQDLKCALIRFTVGLPYVRIFPDTSGISALRQGRVRKSQGFLCVSFVTGQTRPVCRAGHLDSVEVTAINTIGGSTTGDDLSFFWRTPPFWVKYIDNQGQNICQSSNVMVPTANT